MYLADYHTHSDSSPDGKETIAHLAEAAIAKGLQEICITDHVDTVCWGSYAPRWDYDWEKSLGELEEARRLYGNRLTIRLGAELGEANLAFDRAEHLLSHAPKLDFVIGSVHMAGKKFGNFDLYYVEKNSETYYHALIDSYLEDVLSLARWGKFSVLGHLTLPLRYINENLGERMTFDSHMEQVEEIFRTMIPKGWVSNATPTGATPPCRTAASCGCTGSWAARSSPWVPMLIPATWWAAPSASGSSSCGTADSGISVHSRKESPFSDRYKRKRRTRP